MCQIHLCGTSRNCCLISLFYIKPQLCDRLRCVGWVVLYLCSTSNHNPVQDFRNNVELSYIFVLHQTTTSNLRLSTTSSCLISLFYIKPQLDSGGNLRIKSCLISLFYIKPQRHNLIRLFRWSCLISLFYIKPQPLPSVEASAKVVLYLCSTSNHNSTFDINSSHTVVLYLCSTSNHNRCFCSFLYPYVVLYLCSTSNHNPDDARSTIYGLSYIFVLHQTTTYTLYPTCI